MQVRTIGNHPLAKDENGLLISRIATIFLDDCTLITKSGMNHAAQQLFYISYINQERKERGIPPLTDFDQDAMLYNSVDLVMSGDNILIRPAADRIRQAMNADELLQQIVPKQNIRFLRSDIPAVKQAIRERGEYWRICPRPMRENEIRTAVQASRIALGGNPIYYYNEESGTRYLTLQDFALLAELPPSELRQHLVEIRDFSTRRNKSYKLEVAFFGCTSDFSSRNFDGIPFEDATDDELRQLHQKLFQEFAACVPDSLQHDDLTSTIWLNTMCARLYDDNDDTLADNVVSDLTPEFFRMIRWLPGGRFKNGELVFDPIFLAAEEEPEGSELKELCDPRIKGFIGNYIREFGTLQYVNIGWVTPSMRRRHRHNGHRVYLAEIMPRSADRPLLRILRIQQWGVREHLDRGHDYDFAASQSTEYTEYTFDRRLACWELGMPLPGRIDTRMLIGPYTGTYAERFKKLRIWTIYYERDFIKGIATDKLPDAFMRDKNYSLAVARLLGQAAAPNLIVGRATEEGSHEVVFDTGDEVIITDENGWPHKIVVADHAGTFNNYTDPLVKFANGYAKPVTRRLKVVPDPDTFTTSYLAAMHLQLTKLKQECRLRHTEFMALFQDSSEEPRSFKDRWQQILQRLADTDIDEVIEAIRQKITKG